MRLGVLLPHVRTQDEHGDFLQRETFMEWCRRIDSGPFSTLAVGDRVTYNNYDQLVALSAAAAITSRVRLMSAIMIVPSQAPDLLAKRIASIDVLSRGRLILGVGIGRRKADYAAAGAQMMKPRQQLEAHIDEMRRIWGGASSVAGGDPIGPNPVQAGGPRIYSAAYGPRALESAARWADGNYTRGIGRPDHTLEERTSIIRAAWRGAGRKEAPELAAPLWYALGNSAENLMSAAIEEYFVSQGKRFSSSSGSYEMGPSGEEALDDVLTAYEAAGWDEVILTPVTPDLQQLELLESFIAARSS